MSRLTKIDPKNAEGKAKALLDAVQAKLGLTPNMTRAMASSPAVLEGYLGLAGALGGGLLDGKMRERIALAVAEANSCAYCLSAHTLIGKGAGLDEAEIAASRAASSGNPRTQEVLRFAKHLVVNRGETTNADVGRLRAAGLSDGEIGEIIANVALNLFTNYFNHVAEPEIDFPVVEPRRAA